MRTGNGPTPRTAFRLSAETLALIADLRKRLAPAGGSPLSSTEVLRVALARLDESTSMDSSKQQKKR